VTVRRCVRSAVVAAVVTAFICDAGAAEADVTVRGEDVSLLEAVGIVSEQAPGLMYVVYGGDADTRDLDLTCRTADDAVDRLLVEFEADGTVVGDLWIIRGSRASVRVRDARSAVLESLLEGDPLRLLLEGQTGDAPRATEEVLADILIEECGKQLAEAAPEGCLAACGVTLAHDDARAAELLASFFAPQQDRERERLTRAEWLLRVARVCAAGTAICVCLPTGEPLWGPYEVADPSADGVTELEAFGPDGKAWSRRWRLSSRVDVAGRGTLGELAREIGGQAGLRVVVPDGLAELLVAVRLDDLASGTALVGLSVATGVPVEAESFCESAVYGGGPVGTRTYSEYGLDTLLAGYTCDTLTVDLAARAFTDEEWALLREAGGVSLSALAPRLRHALLRDMAGGVDIAYGVADRLLARYRAGADVHIHVMTVGDRGYVQARIMTGKGPMRTLNYRVVARGPHPALQEVGRGIVRGLGLEGPAHRVRLTHRTYAGPRPPDELAPDGKGGVVHAGPVARPSEPETGGAAGDATRE